MRITLLSIALCSLLMGCQQSPQKNYFLLSGPTYSTETSHEITQAIGIGPIELPEYLQRPQMVLHNNNNKLTLADNHYWAEPLDTGITRVLALHLTAQDSSRVLLPFPWRSDSKPTRSVRLHIHELKLIDGLASINATWELFDNTQKKRLQQHHFIRSVESQDSALSMATAYSELLAQLAAEMNKALNTPSTLESESTPTQ